MKITEGVILKVEHDLLERLCLADYPKPKVLENCERNGFLIPMKPGDFCSYGERKDNEA